MNWNLANRLGLKLQVQEAKLEFSVVDFSLLASRSAGDLILPIDLAKTFKLSRRQLANSGPRARGNLSFEFDKFSTT